MVITDALEGVIDSRLVFHYDLNDDVLFLRQADRREGRRSASRRTTGLSCTAIPRPMSLSR